jgi:hypothetical protein
VKKPEPDDFGLGGMRFVQERFAQNPDKPLSKEESNTASRSDTARRAAIDNMAEAPASDRNTRPEDAANYPGFKKGGKVTKVLRKIPARKGRKQ